MIVIIVIIIIKFDISFGLPININWNICQYLSMHFLVSKVLIWMLVKFLRMTSPKAVCILFQTLIAFIVL